MSSDPNCGKPIRAAKAAAIQNAVWHNPTGLTSTPVKGKCCRSPDAPSAPVKQKRQRTPDNSSASASTKKARSDSSEDVSSDDQDDVRNPDLDACAVCARFNKEGADWGIEGAFGQVDDGGVHDGPPQTTSEDGDFDIDERKPVKWDVEKPSYAESTCTDSGTPLSSGEDGDAEMDDIRQVTTDRHTVNKDCLRNQPQLLRMIIRATINRVAADLVFDTAYCPVDGLVTYFRHALWRSARTLNLADYAKRFEQDVEFGKAFGQVLNGRVSIFRGQVKRNAANKVEGYYQLLCGAPGIDQIKVLCKGSKYIYPSKKGPDGQDLIESSKPFAHPAIIALLRDTFLVSVRGGSFATRNQARFMLSLDSRPKELEIPRSMLALVATSIHSALDDHANGVLRKTDFNADIYEDVYLTHMTFLAHIREESLTKYHRMMAGLYATASTISCAAPRNVFVACTTAVTTDDAICQLDLAGMEE
ncbi:hypothetical protein V8E53_013274 [Lactarius tabidus]